MAQEKFLREPASPPGGAQFLTDVQAAAYAAYNGAPSRPELERFFFLDVADWELIEGERRSHNRLGFTVQLTTARYLGVFLDDPTDVPAEVVDYLAEQLGIADASALKAYGERENTRLAHVRELRKVLEYTEFAEAEAELRVWVDARAWTTGEGPKALFDAAVGWLRGRRVLLPGVTTLARLVASVREAANQRMWDSLYGLLSTGQRAVLDSLLTVPPGARVSELDRLRRGPVRISGPQMKWALERAAEIDAFGMGEPEISGIPPRRLAELSRQWAAATPGGCGGRVGSAPGSSQSARSRVCSSVVSMMWAREGKTWWSRTLWTSVSGSATPSDRT